MHPLHDYVAKQLAERLKARRVVVWYDVRREFAEYGGSLFEIRALVEPFVSSDAPETLVIYVPGMERDRRGSVLMEGAFHSASAPRERQRTCLRANSRRSDVGPISLEDMEKAIIEGAMGRGNL